MFNLIVFSELTLRKTHSLINDSHSKLMNKVQQAFDLWSKPIVIGAYISLLIEITMFKDNFIAAKKFKVILCLDIFIINRLSTISFFLFWVAKLFASRF